MARSRDDARALVDARRVLVAGSLAQKRSRLVDAAEPLEVLGPPERFVSRGGDKLEAALDRFAVAVAGRRALDVGASTGGFTDCLLQRGAESVLALDVGHGQLHVRLRNDPRVTVRERCNVRHVAPAELDGPFALVVCDVSFISLHTVLAALLASLAPRGDLVVLVKPQFEAGRIAVSRGSGVIRDPAIWRECLESLASDVAARGAAMMGLMVSPLRGAAGNVEFLAHLQWAVGAVPPSGLLVAEALTMAEELAS